MRALLARQIDAKPRPRPSSAENRPAIDPSEPILAVSPNFDCATDRRQPNHSTPNSDPQVRQTAGALVAGIPDVRKELDEVQVAEGNGIRETSAAITVETKIKTALRRASGVHSVNMRWRSVGGTVYLFGRARSKAEQESAIYRPNPAPHG